VCFLAGCEPEPTPWRSHVHKGIELGVVFGGTHRIRIGDVVRTCRMGDTWICGMWEPHAWRSLERDTCVAVLTFLPEAVDLHLLDGDLWLNMLAVPPASRPRPQTAKERERVLHLTYDLYEEVREKRDHAEAEKLLGLCRLLLELERCWRPDPQELAQSAQLARLSEYDRVWPAVELVETAAGTRVRVAEAAQACGLSRSRFQLVFGRAMGVTFHQFCMRARIGVAAYRLLTTDDSVPAIAAGLGFADGSHLHRNFVKHCGCTPGEYRAGRVLPPKSAQILAIGSLMLSPEVSVGPAEARNRPRSRFRRPLPQIFPSPSYYRPGISSTGKASS
jgi:AraC-like DNA-binding protein